LLDACTVAFLIHDLLERGQTFGQFVNFGDLLQNLFLAAKIDAECIDSWSI
jgi:hypothetical protein